jgi:hypothetical protein
MSDFECNRMLKYNIMKANIFQKGSAGFKTTIDLKKSASR